jgi:oligoendopeptidase F
MNALAPNSSAPPVWDLSDLYAAPTDPKIAADLDQAEALARKQAGREGAFLAARGDPAALGVLIAAAISTEEAIVNLTWAVAAYASLSTSTARGDPALAKFEADVRARVTDIGALTLFLSLELNQLEDAEIEAALVAEPDAARWRPWLRRVRAGRPHELSRELEKLMLERSPALEQWTRLYDETLARLQVSVGRERLTLNEALNRLSDAQPARRRLAADGLAEALKDAAPVLGLAFNTRALEKRIEDRWRKFPTPASSRHLANEVDAAAVDAMVARPWIDAAPRPGKSSGAYSHPLTADKHPYVFLNFVGERRDVLTLAHELGHAVHQTLTRPLGTLLADTPLTLAETASIFAEGLVFDRLLAQAKPSEKRGLLAGRIEDGLNTVVRQVAFHRFETAFHAARAEGEVSAEATGKIWLEAMGESLGDGVTLNPGYEWYWAYVSHFVHTPFYVYAYAFGDLLVAALMERRRQDPVGFAPLYETLLAGGGSKTYLEALAPFGFDPREKAFWATGLDRLERMVDAFEALG